MKCYLGILPVGSDMYLTPKTVCEHRVSFGHFARQMHAFGGKLTVIVQAGENPGDVTLKVNAKGLQSGVLTIPVEK